MADNYDLGEGPSSGNLQDKCSLCDFTTHDRVAIIEHLGDHIMYSDDTKRTKNNSLEDIKMALNQLRFFHTEDNHPTSSENDDQKEEKNSVKPEVPKVNPQSKKKTYPCKKCNFIAMSKIENWNHISKHMNENKIMYCFQCPFVTQYKHHLQYHVMKHLGSKPYKCSSCTYSCFTNSMLSSHKKLHSDIYQYRCQDCSYATRYAHTFKQHLRKYKHEPGTVLNDDGTESQMVIDVYGRKRGPKSKTKDNHANKNMSTSTSTSTSTATAESVQKEERSASTTAQMVGNSTDDSNSNSTETTAQQFTSRPPQTLQSSSSWSALSTMPARPNITIFHSIFSKRDNNLVIQKDKQTGQEKVHFPFQYSHLMSTTPSMKEQTKSTTTASDNSERENFEDSKEGEIMTPPAMDTAAVDQDEFLGNSTSENTDMPLNLTSKSLKSGASSNQTSCKVLPLNPMKSSRMASIRRRKGISINLQHQIVEKEEDTDEETTQNEKRLCQSASPQPASAPSTSFATTSAPSTSSQIASIPTTLFTTAFTWSTSFMAASTPSPSRMDTAAQTAVSISPEKSVVDADDFADPRQKGEEKLTHNRSPSSQDHFMCLHCDIVFPDQTIYTAHTRFHDNKEPFMCKVCGNSYGNREAFNLHIFENKCHKQQ